MESPQPSPGTAGVFGYRGVPANPRNIQAVAGTGQCTLSWSAPGDVRGVDVFRVYLDTPANLAYSIADNALTQFVLQMAHGTKRMAFVSCLSSFGRESNKLPIVMAPL
jgi:hypothetical protein